MSDSANEEKKFWIPNKEFGKLPKNCFVDEEGRLMMRQTFEDIAETFSLLSKKPTNDSTN